MFHLQILILFQMTTICLFSSFVLAFPCLRTLFPDHLPLCLSTSKSNLRPSQISPWRICWLVACFHTHCESLNLINITWYSYNYKINVYFYLLDLTLLEDSERCLLQIFITRDFYQILFLRQQIFVECVIFQIFIECLLFFRHWFLD